MKNTAYDDVFKTLINGPAVILISLINEVFDTEYPNDVKITSLSEEYLFPEKGNEMKKVIADSVFCISHKGKERYYHLECQSYDDENILFRMLQYDMQIAFRNSYAEDAVLHVSLPDSAIILLHNGKRVPKDLYVQFEGENGSLRHPIRTLKIIDYDVQTIVSRRLYFLIPFYIFVFPGSSMKKMEKDPKERRGFISQFVSMIRFLNEELESGLISVYIYRFLLELANIVVEKYTERYNEIRKELNAAMGGEFIQTRSWTEYHEGLKEGEAIGLEKGEILGTEKVLQKLVQMGKLEQEEASRLLQEMIP